jgi:two-component system sensor histidine kinase KdpD
VLSRAAHAHDGAVVTELDVAAMLRHRPDVVVVDELAYTNAPRSRHAKRWQDVEAILQAGISVLTTVDM